LAARAAPRGGRADSSVRLPPLPANEHLDGIGTHMLLELMQRNADEIVGRWLEDGISTYAPEAVPALTRQRDRFANPLGHSLRVGTRAIFDALVRHGDDDAMRSALDEIVRMRAVQQLSPSEALGFLFRLKDHLRAELGSELEYPGVRRQLTEMDRRIDEVALVAFDLYVDYRERLAEVRISEIKRTTPWFVGKMALVGEEGG